MKQYHIDDFIPIVLSPKKIYAINFRNERAFNINSALLNELGRWIEIFIHPTDSVLCLRKAKEGSGIHFPASGSLQKKELSAALIERNIKPPICFSVYKQDNYWIATADEVNIPDTVPIDKPSKRPRKVNPARILAGVGDR